jgi:hypothetical protein
MVQEKGAVEQALEEETEPIREFLAKRPLIQNLPLTSADTEYKIPIPHNVRKYLIQARTSYDLRLAFEKGAVEDTTLGKDYLTVKAGDAYWEDNLDLEGTMIIYVACSTAAVIVEIVKWLK